MAYTFSNIHRIYYQVVSHYNSYFTKEINKRFIHSFIHSFNSNNMTDDCLSLNFQQNFNGRNEMIQFFNMSNFKVGRNLLVNRFHSLNNKIKFTWFNDSFESFKIKCKNILLLTCNIKIIPKSTLVTCLILTYISKM